MDGKDDGKDYSFDVFYDLLIKDQWRLIEEEKHGHKK